jgi:hypothetical protein
MIAYYLQVYGKRPRKRKHDRFEVRLDAPDMDKAKDEVKRVVETHKLREVKASYAPWGVSESKFTDSNGVEQTLVMRNIFPSGNSIEVIL